MLKKGVKIRLVGKRTATETTWWHLAECRNQRQYQVEVDPVRLRAYDLSIQEIKKAIQRSNIDVGGRLVEMAEREFMVRGLGYVKDVRDLEQVVLGVGPGGIPILLRDVARIIDGPAEPENYSWMILSQST